MIIDPSLVKYIQKVISTGYELDIVDLLIEPGLVRGANDDRTAFILITQDVPSFPFGTMAINRLDLFQSRLSLANNSDTFQVEAETRDEFVRSLILKGKGLKVEYRCANPKIFEQKKIPKNIKEKIPVCQIKVSSDLVTMIQKGISAMGADYFRFVGTSDGKVQLEIIDVNSDKLTYEIPNDQVLYSTEFTLDFFSKLTLSAFKKSSSGAFEIYANKLLTTKINDLDAYIIAKAETE